MPHEQDDPAARAPATKRWRVGITNRSTPPFVFEDRGFRGAAEFVYLDTSRESDARPVSINTERSPATMSVAAQARSGFGSGIPVPSSTA